MRAGSLSNPRVIAMLRKYFVPCHVPATPTAHLIERDDDRELLERLSERYPNIFDGGVREAFLSPDGKVVEAFSNLYLSPNGPPQQYDAKGRADERFVRRAFRRASCALRECEIERPDDFLELLGGTAPEVARVRGETVRWPTGPGLRVWVRNSSLMYDSLVGCELIDLDDLEALTPRPPEPGATVRWPEQLVRKLGRAAVPRGQVLTEIDDESIEGEVRARVESVRDGKVFGQLTGRLELRPTRDDEVSYRSNAAKLFISDSDLRGYFVYDLRERRYLAPRLVNAPTTFRFLTPFPGQFGPDTHRFAIELAR